MTSARTAGVVLASALIRVQIKADRAVAPRSRKVALLRATWAGDATRIDLVKAVAKVRG